MSSKPEAIKCHKVIEHNQSYTSAYTTHERNWRQEKDKAEEAERTLKHLQEDLERRDRHKVQEMAREERELKDEISTLKTRL